MSIPTSITGNEGPSHPSRPGHELPARALQALQSLPPIDRNWLLEQCLDNLDFALTLLDEFAKTSPSRLAAFDAALAEHDYAAIAAKAHALKGTAGILAANTLMESCSNLESAATSEDRNQTSQQLQQLCDEVQRVIDFIPSIRAS